MPGREPWWLHPASSIRMLWGSVDRDRTCATTVTAAKNVIDGRSTRIDAPPVVHEALKGAQQRRRRHVAEQVRQHDAHADREWPQAQRNAPQHDGIAGRLQKQTVLSAAQQLRACAVQQLAPVSEFSRDLQCPDDCSSGGEACEILSKQLANQ